MRRLAWICVALLFGCAPRTPAPKPTDDPARFVDVTRKAGVDFVHHNGAQGAYRYIEVLPGGCALFDYDNDGDLDLLLVQSGPSDPPPQVIDRPPSALYRNRGDGTFDNATAGSGLDRDLGYGYGVAVGDVDNDGFEDVLVTYIGGVHLLRNEEGSGRFSDVTEAWGLGKRHSTGFATSAAFGDYDNDGRLDLFVAYYAPWTWDTDIPCEAKPGVRDYCQPQKYDLDTSQLFHNEGGRFIDVSAVSGIGRVSGRGLVAAFRDLDEDGRIDLIVGNDMSGNVVWRNAGKGKFEDASLTTGLGLRGDGMRMSAMGFTFADVDHSGHESLYVTDFAGAGNPFFLNRGRGLYEEAGASAGIAAPTLPFVSFGCEFIDFDADGWPDLITANGHVSEHVADVEANRTYREPQLLLRNVGDGKFEAVSGPEAGPLAEPALGRGLATGDIDNDGRVDAVIVRQNAAPLVLRNNDRSKNHWVSFSTVGTRSNRDGRHTRVTVTTGGEKQTATVRSGTSYLSASDRRLFFGIGERTTVDSVEIRWPSGKIERLSQLPADTFYTLTEGSGVSQKRSPVPH